MDILITDPTTKDFLISDPTTKDILIIGPTTQDTWAAYYKRTYDKFVNISLIG